jgi:hypothetical protein
MINTDLRTRINAIPNWAYEALRVMADAHRMTANIETELRYATHLQGMDQRMHDKLLSVREAVGVLQVTLSALEVTAQQVLSEVALDAAQTAQPNPER